MDLYHSIASCGQETTLLKDTDSVHMPEKKHIPVIIHEAAF